MRGSDEVFSPVPLAASSRRYAQLYSAAGGLDTGVDATLLEDGKAAELRNFHIKDGVLQSREALVKTAVEAPPGDLHARIAFDGAVYFHIGTGLYRFDGETFTPSAVSFPDAPSAFVMTVFPLTGETWQEASRTVKRAPAPIAPNFPKDFLFMVDVPPIS